MTQDDAAKVAAVVCRVDDGCSHCGPQALRALKTLFPSIDWTDAAWTGTAAYNGDGMPIAEPDRPYWMRSLENTAVMIALEDIGRPDIAQGESTHGLDHSKQGAN